MDIIIPDNILSVMRRLRESGYEAYIVGGCVRDSLLGLVPNDYDIATNALPEQTKACFSDMLTIDTGIKHGTVTVVSDHTNVEITTFRVDGDYSDLRRPDSVSFTDSLTADMSRRDFTINAMAYSDETGVIDRFGGQRDLFRHIIRSVGDPKKRFGEDALRILRALRFAAQLDFEIEEKTSEAIHEMCSLLGSISAERIRTELEKLLCSKAPAEVLINYADVFSEIIPEFKNSIGFDQHSPYHVYDVWKHIAYAVEHSKNVREVRLALFFHDIAKPACFVTDDEGRGHFPKHELLGEEMTERIMRRLRFDNKTIKTVCELVKYHYVTPIDDDSVIKRLLSVIGSDQLKLLIEVLKGDSRAKEAFCLERVNVLDSMKIRMYEILSSSECWSLDTLAIDGTDVAKLGFEGKHIGEVLDKLLSDVIEGDVQNEKEALSARALRYKKELQSI